VLGSGASAISRPAYRDLEIECLIFFLKEVNPGDSAPSRVRRGRDTFLQGVFQPDYALSASGLSCLVAEVLPLPKTVV